MKGRLLGLEIGTPVLLAAPFAFGGCEKLAEAVAILAIVVYLFLAAQIVAVALLLFCIVFALLYRWRRGRVFYVLGLVSGIGAALLAGFLFAMALMGGSVLFILIDAIAFSCAVAGLFGLTKMAKPAPAVPVLSPEVSPRDRNEAHSELNCPRCVQRMFVGKADDTVLNGCGRCSGLWLSNQDSQRAVERFPRGAYELAERATAAAKIQVDTQPPIQCPVCGDALQRVTVEHAQAEVNVCRQHGTWFDCGVLLRVARVDEEGAPPGNGEAE